MKLQLRFLRHAAGVRAILQNDGWRFEQEKDASLLAWHPDAPDEVSARTRLHRLGLLISGSLRIDFRPLQQHPDRIGTSS